METIPPRISVIIPTYNRRRQLGAALESVLQQTYSAAEIIIIDDGSTDSTDELVKSYRQRAAVTPRPEITLLSQPNSGPANARNRGIAAATGTWIAFLDSDDTWLPNKLRSQVRALDQYGSDCGVCFSNAQLIDRGGRNVTAFQQSNMPLDEETGVISDAAPPLATEFGGIWVQTILARRDLVQRAGGFDREIKFGEDYDFIFRLSLLTKFCYVADVLAVIDRTTAATDAAVMTRKWDTVDYRLGARQRMYEKWATLPLEHRPDVRRLITKSLGGTHSGWTNWYLEKREYRKAKSAILKAVRYKISATLVVKLILVWVVPRVARKVVPPTATIL